MPRTNKTEAPIVVDAPILTTRQVDFDGFSVPFEEYHIDADGTPVFRGLPDDRCHCPHWGVVVSGELRLRYGGMGRRSTWLETPTTRRRATCPS